MIITYVTLAGYMLIIGSTNPFLNAIVPTVGFNISTWSLPCVKTIWLKYQQKGSEVSALGTVTDETQEAIKEEDFEADIYQK
jgi:hypothetical protein